MKRKLIKKYKELEKELFDIFEMDTDIISAYDEANLRRRIIIVLAQIELLEEILDEDYSQVLKVEKPIIFNLRKEEKNNERKM